MGRKRLLLSLLVLLAPRAPAPAAVCPHPLLAGPAELEAAVILKGVVTGRRAYVGVPPSGGGPWDEAAVRVLTLHKGIAPQEGVVVDMPPASPCSGDGVLFETGEVRLFFLKPSPLHAGHLAPVRETDGVYQVADQELAFLGRTPRERLQEEFLAAFEEAGPDPYGQREGLLEQVASLQEPFAVPRLLPLLAGAATEWERCRLYRTLLGLGGLDTSQVLTDLVRPVPPDPQDYRVRGCVAALGELRNPQALPYLRELLKRSPDARAREAAARAILKTPSPENLPILIEILAASPDPAARREALRGIRAAGGGGAAPVLVRALDDPSRDVQYEAVRALCEITRSWGPSCPERDAFDRDPAAPIRQWKGWWVWRSSATAAQPEP